MEGRVGPNPGDSGWHSDDPPDLPAARRRKKPAGHPSEAEQPSPTAEDHYAPSEPDEEA